MFETSHYLVCVCVKFTVCKKAGVKTEWESSGLLTSTYFCASLQMLGLFRNLWFKDHSGCCEECTGGNIAWGRQKDVAVTR